MVPVLVGAAAVAAGAALMSDDKPKQTSTQNKRNISEKQVMQRLNRAGRGVKTVGDMTDNFSREQEIFSHVRRIIKEQLDVSYSEIQMTSTFVGDLGADSLDIVELIMAFEEEYNIEIPGEAAEKISTVGDAVRYISSR